MKKLHKLLALVLALATVFSLTVGGYAAEVGEETETPDTAATEEAAEEPAEEEAETEEIAEDPAEDETVPEETPEETEEAPDTEAEEPADPEETPDETPAELPAETPAEEPAEEPTEEPADPDEGVLAASDTASGTCGDNLTWTLDSSGTLTISGTGEMVSGGGDTADEGENPYCYGIPWYDYHESITTVVLDEGVTSIGDFAFYYCNNMKSVTIPDSVTSVGNAAFAYCFSLPNLTIPDSVTTIGDGAFLYCRSLISMSIPDSVTTIGGAFVGCTSLTSVTIGEGVVFIATVAFDNCRNLMKISVAAGNSMYSSSDGVLYNKNKTIIVRWPELKTNMKIPNGVTSIGERAFGDCTSLTSVTIPDGVTSIGEKAFGDCTSLTSVTIPDSVTSIGEGAFWDCSKLTSMTIPNGVLSIGDCTFCNCSSLASVTIPNSVTAIGNAAFMHCHSLTSIIIPDSVTSIDSGAFMYCSSLTSVTIPDSVAFIGTQAFTRCTSLSSVTLGKGLTCVDENAFTCCDKLTSVIIPANVKEICAKAFGFLDPEQISTVSDSGGATVANSGNYVKMDGFTIYGYVNTAAETYAKENGFTFRNIGGKTKLSDCTITLSKSTMPYTGKALKPAVTVKDGKTTLTSGTDYTVNYSNNTNIGTATVKITGKGNYTGTVTKTFKIALGTPAPSRLSNASTGLKLSWNSVAGASKYAIYRKEPYGKNKWVKLTEVTGTSYTDTTVTSGVTYAYAVRSRKGANMSAQSASLTLRYLSTPKVTSVKNELSGINVTWNKTKGCSGYNVYRKYKGGSYKKIAVVRGANNLTYFDKTGNNGTIYTYQVYAFSGSSVSTATSKTITRLTAPTLKNVTNPTSRAMKITWSANTRAAGYEVKYVSGSFSKTVTVSGSGATSVTRTNLTKGKTFKVYIRCYQTVNGVKYYSAWSHSKTVTISK